MSEKNGWTSDCEVNKQDSNQNAAVIRLPPYPDASITRDVDVEICVITGPSRDRLTSQPATFTYQGEKKTEAVPVLCQRCSQPVASNATTTLSLDDFPCSMLKEAEANHGNLLEELELLGSDSASPLSSSVNSSNLFDIFIGTPSSQAPTTPPICSTPLDQVTPLTPESSLGVVSPGTPASSRLGPETPDCRAMSDDWSVQMNTSLSGFENALTMPSPAPSPGFCNGNQRQLSGTLTPPMSVAASTPVTPALSLDTLQQQQQRPQLIASTVDSGLMQGRNASLTDAQDMAQQCQQVWDTITGEVRLLCDSEPENVFLRLTQQMALGHDPSVLAAFLKSSQNQATVEQQRKEFRRMVRAAASSMEKWHTTSRGQVIRTL